MNYTQRFSRLATLAGVLFGMAIGVEGRAAEVNGWPFFVRSGFPNATTAESAWMSVGPLGFKNPGGSNHATWSGIRPLWVEKEDPGANSKDVYSVYPLFSYHRDPEWMRWSVFSIIRASRPLPTPKNPTADARSFEVWPIYLARYNPATGDDYRAVFPLYGNITNRFGDDRWRFVLFPLFSRSERNGRIQTQTPWPIIRTITGDGHKGFEVWPVYGHRERANDYTRTFYLWPLGFHSKTNLDAPVPTENVGFLPFYARSTGPGYRSETFGWPFFGYSDRTEPYRYHQTNYFWPLLVQGRGDNRYVNRWGPFFSHSVIKGRDKRWIMWPLYRREIRPEGALIETDHRVLLFIYRSTQQNVAGNPGVAPARRTHLWPLFSKWDNGAGREQLQVLSPIEPFFSSNEAMRQSYSPLFAVYRFNQTAPGVSRHSLLWDLISLTRKPDQTEFNVGPLFKSETGTRKRFSLGMGLLGIERRTDGRWRPFLFNFDRSAPAPAATP